MVSQNGKTGGPLLAGKEGREEISNAGWREFLGTALVPGLLLDITTPLVCHSTTSLQISKVLAEIMCHGNKILSLSKSEFGEDPNGVTNFTNQMEDMPRAVRSLFPHGMKWLSKKRCRELEPRKNGHYEAAGYLVVSCTSCVYLYQTDIFWSIRYILNIL